MKICVINFTVILHIFTVNTIIFTYKNNNFTDKIFYPKFDELQHIPTNAQTKILSHSYVHTIHI